jgi:hypothetical protein
MKIRVAVFSVLASTMFAQHSQAVVLPDACGNEEVKFAVATQKGHPAPGALDSGKALIVFIETLDRSGNVSFLGGTTTRFGLDGNWAGANKGNSYFAHAVDPGEHHLCVNWQTIGPDGRKVGVASFTAEPGKTYYFEARITQKGWGGGGVHTEESLDLKELSEDEGEYRVKVSALSTSKVKN